jgi:hypothetical protein
MNAPFALGRAGALLEEARRIVPANRDLGKVYAEALCMLVSATGAALTIRRAVDHVPLTAENRDTWLTLLRDAQTGVDALAGILATTGSSLPALLPALHAYMGGLAIILRAETDGLAQALGTIPAPALRLVADEPNETEN